MSEKKLIDKFIELEQKDTYREIFNELLDASENLALKSHIKNPLALTYFKFYSYALEQQGYTNPSKLVDIIITIFLEYMISYNRLSRTEILSTLSATLENLNISTKDKLTKDLKVL